MDSLDTRLRRNVGKRVKFKITLQEHAHTEMGGVLEGFDDETITISGTSYFRRHMVLIELAEPAA